MPLNYSKWDQLELSDDSDIEGHPNVDKRSLIRWKQRDIHEKREARKHKIIALAAEIDCNRVLEPRLRRVRERFAGAVGAKEKDDGKGELWAEDTQDVASLTGLPLFQALVERLQTSPSSAAPPTNAPNQPTYDAMVLSLLLQIYESVKSLPRDEQEKGVLDGLDKHIKQLGEHTRKLESDLDAEVKEQKKHITSDDIKESWESKYVPPKPAPPPIKNALIDPVPKKTPMMKTTYEILNPEASGVTSGPPPSSISIPAATEFDDDPAELPELTPALARFSRLPLWAYAQSFSFIQENRDVVVPGASDALLVAAFQAQTDGRKAYAKQCVHQSLLLQYSDKLGKDGIRVFFQKMITGDKRAIPIFVKDVEDTYAHLVSRVAATLAASASTKEQIQLVPENPNSTITFNVPDGPPPDNLVLEGPGTEDLDVEEVRKALYMRWTVFEGFPEKLKAALREGKLDGVNKVLGEMEVPEAEDVVSKLDIAGIMSFAEGGIRDETRNAGDAEEGK